MAGAATTVGPGPAKTPDGGRGPAGVKASPEAMVLGVVAALGVAVIGLWWRDTPAHSLRTLSDRLTGAGRITGLLGTYLVLVEVLLMARVPWLDRAIGTDRLVVWHKRNGQYVVGLLVAHTLLIIWGYGLADHRSLANETGNLVLRYPDVLAATAGLALFLAIAATSVRLARARLRYETWYFVHLYTYLAIALSFAHQFATGNEFSTHPLSRTLWVLLYLLAFGPLLIWRVALPARQARRHRFRVTKVVREGPRHVSVYISGRHLEEVGAVAGQHFRWRFLTRDNWWQAHPYSLSAAPDRRHLRITVKTSGDHSASLAHLRRGTHVVAEGPYGAFTHVRRRHQKVLLIAGGVGITPLRALFEELPARPGDLTLLYRASEPEDVVLTKELDAIARAKGATVKYAVGPRTMEPDPLSARALRRVVDGLADHDVYVCGPPGMADAVTRALGEAGVPRSQIHTEDFAL